MNTKMMINAVLRLTAAQSKPSRELLDENALADLDRWIDEDLARLVEENSQWHSVKHNREKFGR